MSEGGAEEIVGRVYRKAVKFLEKHTQTEVMDSGDPQLIREYEFSQQFVEQMKVFLVDKYYRYLLL